jgi:hypothetical protein
MVEIRAKMLVLRKSKEALGGGLESPQASSASQLAARESSKTGV